MKKNVYSKLTKVFVCLMMLILTKQAQAQYNVTVAKDGTGNYLTLQQALDAAPTTATAPYRIFIKKGVYKENLTIAKKFIQFIGEDVAKTVITYDNSNGKAIPGGGTYGTANSASVIINADDFSSANITFENSTGDAPQALAINVSGDRASFKNCRFLGGQDTFLSYNSKYPQSLYKCYIEGVVDFIFGNAKTVFDECTIYPRDRSDNNGSYITASNTRESKGFLFRNCEIIANRGLTKYVLGRPWQNDAATTTDKSTAATVFINTKMSSVVKPEGWAIWDAGTDVSKVIFAEYNSMDIDGNLLNVASRVAWSKQLTNGEVAEYLDNNVVFKDRNNTVWDPYAVFLDGNAVPQNRLAISNFKYVKSGTELTFAWNLNWPENNVVYKLYRIADGGAPVLVNEQTINGNNVNVAYAPATGKEVVPPSMSTYEYYVTATSANGTVTSESVSISAIPVLTLTGTLQNFKQGIDKASASQILTLSGEYLQENVTVKPPVNFEVSADNGTNWSGNANPLVLSVSSGLLTSKTILVRLNAATAGLYSGSITIISGTGAHNKTIAVAGETYNNPLVNSKSIASLSLADNSNATYLREGVATASLNLNTYLLSTQSTGTNVPYSANYGIQFGPTAAGGGWGANEIKNMNDKTKYIEITLNTASTYEARIDSLLFNLAVFQTTGNFAVEYSTDNFTTSTLLKSGLLNGSPLTVTGSYATFADGTWLLENQNAGTKRYAFALNGANGVKIAAGQAIKVRMYFRTGSSSDARYATLKNIDFKGSVTKAAVNGDYMTVKSGNWDDITVWKKYDGTTWNTVTAYPVYNSGGTSIIDNGHVVLLPTVANGSGYINNFIVREGGKLTIPSTSVVKFATQSSNFVVEGELVNEGNISNNGAFNLTVKGNFTNSSGGLLKIDAATSQLIVGEDGILDNSGTIQSTNSLIQVNKKGTLINKNAITNGASGSIVVQLGGTFTNKSTVGYTNLNVYGTYEHAANSNTMPAILTFQDGSTFLISGITTSQTGILKNSLSYYNIVWDNAGQTKYYAFQGNLVENVRGKFTVNNTGTQYLALLNASGTIGLGSYEQNGGRVVVRESGTVNAIVNVNGDFVVNGGTFESNSAATVKLNLKGTSGIYKYNDVGNLLNNLVVDVLGNYALQSPVVSSNLTVENGILTLGSNSLTINTVTRLNTATGYVMTNGTGNLIVKNIGTTPVLAPVGTANGYSPVTIANTGTVSDFTISLKPAIDNALPNDPTKSVNLQWSITPSTNSVNANLVFQWNATNHNAGFVTTGAIAVANYHNGAYVNYPATLGGSNPYTATINSVTEFSPFVVINDGVLPLELLSFDAKLTGSATDKEVKVSWTTTNEINTSKFEVLRRTGQGDFSTINIQASKNTPGLHEYIFMDRNPIVGQSYYQLKQIDLDGKFTLSDIKVINYKPVAQPMVAYPNPTDGIVNLKHVALAKAGSVVVYNTQGQQKLTVTVAVGQTNTVVNLATLPAGFYLLRLESNGETQLVKVLKK